MKKPKIKPGETFYAVLKHGPKSRTLTGTEMSGKRLGPFTATKVTPSQIESDDRVFVYQNWRIES